MPRAWVLARRNELQATPRKANYMVAVIRRVLSLAVDIELRPDNPASRIKALRMGAGYRAWTDAEIAMMTGPSAQDVALAVRIALHTGQRQADVLGLVWSAYDGRCIRLRQGKSRHLPDSSVMTIPVHPQLRAALAAAKAANDGRDTPSALICTDAAGRPWRRDGFKHRFAELRTELGMASDMQFHGLRHSAASRLAESGASDAEIQAITGHRTRAMVAKYTAGARQHMLANQAVTRMRRKQAANGRLSKSETRSVKLDLDEERTE